MKKFIVIFTIVLAGCTGFSQKTNTTGDKASILVYFFHGTHRCTGCLNAEKVTVAALNTYYKNELDQGIIKFQSLNVEEDKNKALAEKYEAAWNKLLFIKVGRTEQKVDLTEQAFAYGTDQSAMNKLVKTTVDALLK